MTDYPKITVQHYENCNPNYPEKIETEKPQELIKIELGDDEYLYQCVDCGATSEIFKIYVIDSLTSAQQEIEKKK
jgi:hypothetical protein